MINIFFDIENTIIDDLWNCNFLQDNCDRISKWLRKHYCFTPGLKCHLFTWGWKERSEINEEIVKNIFGRLEIPEANRGIVWTKDDSIQCVFNNKWVNITDEVELEDLHIPGAMKRFGLEKQTCFIQQAKDWIDFKNIAVDMGDNFILIDDTNNSDILVETRSFVNKNNVFIEFNFFHPENLIV